MTESPPTHYFCPGESHPISRAVHLSRLAAFYPKCRECPLRTDTGQLGQRTVTQLQQTEHRVKRSSLLTTNGLRGVYLNEVTRQVASQAATAFAGLLWEHSPLVAHVRNHDQSSPVLIPQSRLRPSIVLAYDERTSSPDLVTGTSLALRRIGCQVIDIGLTTQSQFWFAIDHLQATAGIMITGAGSPPSWTGLDFVGPETTPVSRVPRLASRATLASRQLQPDLTLNEIEHRMDLPPARFTRQAGPQRNFQVNVPYEAGLWKHFHALRPLEICLGTPSRILASTLERVFERLPCRLRLQRLPDRQRALDDPDDSDLRRVGDAVRRSGSHLGMVIDSDGQQCVFLDENGRVVPPNALARLVLRLGFQDTPHGVVVLDSQADSDLASELNGWGFETAVGGATMATMSRAMRSGRAMFGGGGQYRLWHREPFATCDAVLTLARVLSVLSRSDASFSQVARGPADVSASEKT